MPNYIQPLSAIGSGAGGTLGAAAGGASGGLMGRLGDILGTAGDLFDAPRQAAYNVARTGGRLLEDDATWDDALSALPGLGMAGLSMLPGVGLPLAALAGGAAQFLGKKAEDAFAPEGHVNRFQDAGTGALVEALGGDKDSVLQNMAAGAATDPLSFMGAGLGRAAGAAKGAEMGGALGGRWEGIANHLGPQYPGGVEKLTGLIGSPQWQKFADTYPAAYVKDVQRRIEGMAGRPDIQQVLGEMKPGSTFAGAGVEGIATANPERTSVLKLAQPSYMTKGQIGSIAEPVPTRYALDEVLQANRSRPWAGNESMPSIRAEHAPFIDVPGEGISIPHLWDRTEPLREEFQQGKKGLLQSFLEKGVEPSDLHGGNFGRTAAGDFKAHDPGVLRKAGTRIEADVPRAPEMPLTEGTGPERWFVKNILGSPASIRSEIESGAVLSPPRNSSALSKLLEGGGLPPTNIMEAAQPVSSGLGREAIPQIRGLTGRSNLEDLHGMVQTLDDFAALKPHQWNTEMKGAFAQMLDKMNAYGLTDQQIDGLVAGQMRL